MPIYQADPNPSRVSYGTTIGILLLNTRIPFIPGDVGNGSTYKFPVLYRVVQDLLLNRLLVGDPMLAEPIVREAKALEQCGVSAITSDCGYMLYFQKQVVECVKVPVFLSSWMQVPFISRTLAPRKTVGAIVADSRHIQREMLRAAGISDFDRLHIVGMENEPAFSSAILQETGQLDSDAIEREVVSVALNLVREHPDIGAILLECSDLPPYSSAVNQALHLPVFDFITMINYMYSSLSGTSYTGTYL